MYCSKCAAQIDDDALICPRCGCATVNYVRDQARLEASAASRYQAPPKKRATALLLCIFLGGLGAHRFYVGKIGTGLLWLFTLGLCGIGTIIDLISIICNTFTDDCGNTLYDPTTEGMTHDEYDAAAKTPRTVRRIILIVVAAIFVVCVIINFLLRVVW